MQSQITETNLPEIIYHYTSYESFYNIFSTGKLHLGSPWNTNDPMEGEYHHRGLSKEKKQRYFASFSRKFDSRLIWDAYGGLGTGVAIGFKTDKLREVIKRDKKYWEDFILQKQTEDIKIETGDSNPAIRKPEGGLLSDFGELMTMNYDANIDDWNKSPFYKEEDEIKLLISNYWIEFKNLKERHIVPMVETKFIDGKIRDYIALKVFQKESFLETVPEIILGPNFNNNNQPSLENFLQIQFNCSFEYEYLKPSLNEKPLKQNNEEKLTLFVSRGNPISIDRYKDENKK